MRVLKRKNALCMAADSFLIFAVVAFQAEAVCIHSEVIAAWDVCAVFWKEKDGHKVSSDSGSGGR